MKYLLAGAGLKAVPTMGTQDSRNSDVFGDNPVIPHEWWDEPTRCGAWYEDLPFEVLAENRLSPANCALWYGDPNRSSRWKLAPKNNGRFAPSIELDGQVFAPDTQPINGKQSWGDGIIQCCWFHDAAQDKIRYGYCYLKSFTGSRQEAQVWAYRSVNGQWGGDGWYYLDWEGYEPQLVDGRGSFYAEPMGTLLNDESTAARIEGRIVWPGLCEGTSSVTATTMEDFQPSESQQATTYYFGLPVWTGRTQVVTTRDTKIIGIPCVDKDTLKLTWSFLWTTSTASTATYYYNGYRLCDRYDTKWGPGGATPSDKPVYAVYERNNAWPNWKYGWYEFEMPSSLALGSTITLKQYLTPEQEAMPDPVTPADATFTLTSFQAPRSMYVWHHPNNQSNEWLRMDGGMVVGTFNVGAIIV